MKTYTDVLIVAQKLLMVVYIYVKQETDTMLIAVLKDWSLEYIKQLLAANKQLLITEIWLENHPECIFVFGDNNLRRGTSGAAKLRDVVNSYGFITKQLPCNQDNCFFKPNEYLPIYKREINLLSSIINSEPNKTFLITKLGAGLANRFRIFEHIIAPHIKNDLQHKNVVWLW